MLTIEQTREIEMLAMRGRAVASLLGTAADCQDSTRDDISMSAYALECYFADILKTLEPVQLEHHTTLY